jgi:tetratricopeptide (TPR) repeat protein
MRTLVPLLVGFALVPAPARGGSLPDCVAHSRWIEARTHHFDLLSNAPEAEVREQACKLEWLAQAIEQWGPALRDRSGRRVLAYGLAGAGCLDPFRTRFAGRTEDVAGYVNSSALGRYLVYNAGLGSRGSGIAPHEAAHAILTGRMVGLPLCIQEGLAEYFSTFQAGSQLVEYGHPIPWRQACLRTSTPMRLDDLFAMTYESSDYHLGPRRDLFYAESWALVRYLMTRAAEAHDRFDRFLELLQQGKAPRSAFASCFPAESWDELPRILARLASAPAEHVELRLGSELESVEPEMSTLSMRDVGSRLGELMAHVKAPGERAEQPYLDAALAPDGLHARTQATLGWLAEKSGHGAAAERCYQRSLELDSTDARSWFLAGYGEISRWGRAGHMVSFGQLPPELAEARRRLERCLRIAPDDMEALAAWGRTFIFDLQPPEEVLAALERASDALPNRLDILEARVAVLALAGRRSEARSLYDVRVAPHVDAATRLSLEGRINFAAEGTSPGSPAPAGPRTGRGPHIIRREGGARTGETLVPGTGSAPLSFEDPTVWRTIDRALALTRANRLEEARTLFEGLLRRPLDDEARAYVRDAIRRLDGALRR